VWIYGLNSIWLCYIEWYGDYDYYLPLQAPIVIVLKNVESKSALWYVIHANKACIVTSSKHKFRRWYEYDDI
jgi:hypothetical protein